MDSATPPDNTRPVDSRVCGVSVGVVAKMFPDTPLQNIQAHLPLILSALFEADLADRQMIVMALATIRAEVECFEPISEYESPFNTSPGGHAFDLYDYRADLGNRGPADGADFRGRGFVQITGRKNYALHGQAIGLGNQLVENPSMACDPGVAAKLLASFMRVNAGRIAEALAANNLAEARRCVNGGTHGLAGFTAAYTTGMLLLPPEVQLRPAA